MDSKHVFKTLIDEQKPFVRGKIKMEMHIEDNRDEYSTRDQPIQKSFYDRYGFDERDGPLEIKFREL